MTSRHVYLRLSSSLRNYPEWLDILQELRAAGQVVDAGDGTQADSLALWVEIQTEALCSVPEVRRRLASLPRVGGFVDRVDLLAHRGHGYAQSRQTELFVESPPPGQSRSFP